jgi:hypothetical protein
MNASHITVDDITFRFIIEIEHLYALKLKQKINIKGQTITGCCLSSDGIMVFSCYNANTVSFINKEGVELFQIGEDKAGTCTFDTVYIKDTNSVAGSSYVVNARHITVDDITYRFINQI